MPANWDPVQYITTSGPTIGRVDFSTGPLVLTGSQTPTWVDAWIVQSSTGSAQTYYGSKGSGAFAVAGHWIANVQLYSRGKFKPGPAVGIALVYWKDGGNNGYIWWSEDPIELKY
jgi:hypothetical protein